MIIHATVVRTEVSRGGAKVEKRVILGATCWCAGRGWRGVSGVARTNVSLFAMGVRAEWQKTDEKRFKQADFCRAGAHRRDEATRLCAPASLNPR